MVIVPNSNEFYMILALQITVIVVKLWVVIFFGYHWKNATKFPGNTQNNQNYIYSKILFLFYSALLISRIFFMIFDFYFTQFDMTLYYITPYVYFWKIGICISSMGFGFFIYGIEKYFFSLKWKGIPAVFAFVLSFILLFFPIHSQADFELASIIAIIPFLPFAYVTFFYFKNGFQAKRLFRRNTILVALGFLSYATASVAVNASLLTTLESATGQLWDLPMYTLQSILKIISLFFLSRVLRTKPISKWLSNIWIIDRRSGICIFEISFMNIKTDPNLVSGFLTAMQQFGMEMTEKNLKGIIFEDITIYLRANSKVFIVAAVTDDVRPIYVDSMLNTVEEEFMRRFSTNLENLGGDVSIFDNFHPFIEKLAHKQDTGMDQLNAMIIMNKG